LGIAQAYAPRRGGYPCADVAKRSANRSGGGSGKKTALTSACRVVVLHGKETHLRSLRTEELREALEAEFGAVDRIRFDGSKAPVADVLDECRSMGLMQQHRMVVVDEAEKFVAGDARPVLERYAAGPSPDATLVLRTETWRKGKLDQLIEAVGVISKCDEVGAGEAAGWCRGRAEKRHGVTMQAPAARALVARVGADLGRLDAEVAKLASAAGPGGEVTTDLVDELVGRSREEVIWVIQAAMASGDPDQAGRAVRDALGPWRHPEALVSFALMDLGRKLHTASSLLRQGASPVEAREAAKIWGEDRETIVAAAKRVSPNAAARLLNEAVAADVALKTGAPDPARRFERVALRFASAVG